MNPGNGDYATYSQVAYGALNEVPGYESRQSS